MTVLNRMDRFQLALDVIARVPGLAPVAGRASRRCTEALERHKVYVAEHGEDMPEVKEWRWTPVDPTRSGG
jgi:xylulose-5-phosphate/fructose-6-phosphate phosphoketolase